MSSALQGVLDTTVVIHLFRKYRPAVAWLKSDQRYGVTTSTWMEVMEGATSKANQAECKRILGMFELLYLTPSDQDWAAEQLERYQFSHHMNAFDCLIAAVPFRLQIPLYTHNLRDMTPLLGALAV